MALCSYTQYIITIFENFQDFICDSTPSRLDIPLKKAFTHRCNQIYFMIIHTDDGPKFCIELFLHIPQICRKRIFLLLQPDKSYFNIHGPKIEPRRGATAFPNLPEIHDFVRLSVIILNNSMRDSALRSVLPDLS